MKLVLSADDELDGRDDHARVVGEEEAGIEQGTSGKNHAALDVVPVDAQDAARASSFQLFGPHGVDDETLGFDGKRGRVERLGEPPEEGGELLEFGIFGQLVAMGVLGRTSSPGELRRGIEREGPESAISSLIVGIATQSLEHRHEF